MPTFRSSLVQVIYHSESLELKVQSKRHYFWRLIILRLKDKLTRTVKSTRLYRRIHKWLAVPLFIFMFLIGTTGLMLGWKKQVQLLPPTQRGLSATPSSWISLDSIYNIAIHYAQDSLNISPEIDRIDIRPDKGIAKIIFNHHFTELQVDCTTGDIISAKLKTSDIIEKIHDGSIVDYFIRVDNDPVKLIYTTLASSGLILLSFSGFWMWYNPKRIKRFKRNKGRKL